MRLFLTASTLLPTLASAAQHRVLPVYRSPAVNSIEEGRKSEKQENQSIEHHDEKYRKLFAGERVVEYEAVLVENYKSEDSIVVREKNINNKKTLTPDSNVVLASAKYTDAIDSTGWDGFDATTENVDSTTKKVSDKQYFYALGLLEGYALALRIQQYGTNIVSGYFGRDLNIPGYLVEYWENMLEYANEKVSEHPEDPWWQHTGLLLEQMRGVHEGTVQFYMDTDEIWTKLKMEMAEKYHLKNVNLDGGNSASFGLAEEAPAHVKELFAQSPELFVQDENSNSDTATWKRITEKDRCSAFFKLVPNNEKDPSKGYAELFATHNTWTDYYEMVRVVKRMDIKDVKNSAIVNKRMHYYSYPGALASMDDFYILGEQKLAVIETTNQCLDHNRIKEFVTHKSVITPFRALTAGRLSTSGAEWAENFARENSGTQNDMWMIVDYKKFEKNKANSNMPGLFTVLEQMPGVIKKSQYADQTPKLMENGYWASYNDPYYPEIREAGGWDQKEKTSQHLRFFYD